MSWILTDIEIESILRLDGSERYGYFLKKVADEEALWSLWQRNLWALACDADGNEVVPLWPHEKYASLCAKEQWNGYEPRRIDLKLWMNRWVGGMIKDKRAVAVFPSPKDQGVIVSAARLCSDIRTALMAYEE